MQYVLHSFIRTFYLTAAAPPVESEPPEAQSHEQSHDQAGLHDNSSTTQENVERNVNPVIVTSEAEDKVMTDGYSNGVAMLSLEDEQELVEKWSKILGSEYTVKVGGSTKCPVKVLSQY